MGRFVRKNFLQLEVYFDTMTISEICEEKKYSFFTFLASLGGAISLYLGMSFIAMFELFEILIRFFFVQGDNKGIKQ